MKRSLHFIQPALWVAVALLAGACKSAKPLLGLTPTAAVVHKLPPLEISADPGQFVMNDGAQIEDPVNLFKAELQRNVLEASDSATYGYARFVVKKVHTVRAGRSLQAAQVFTFMFPSLLGAPLEWYRTDLQAEVEVLDANGQLLGTYAGHGQSSIKVAMYSGYSQGDAPRLADVVAIREALASIRPQLDTAAARLVPLLKAGGPVSFPTLPGAAASATSTND